MEDDETREERREKRKERERERREDGSGGWENHESRGRGESGWTGFSLVLLQLDAVLFSVLCSGLYSLLSSLFLYSVRYSISVLYCNYGRDECCIGITVIYTLCSLQRVDYRISITLLSIL